MPLGFQKRSLTGICLFKYVGAHMGDSMCKQSDYSRYLAFSHSIIVNQQWIVWSVCSMYMCLKLCLIIQFRCKLTLPDATEPKLNSTAGGKQPVQWQW